MKVFRYGCSFFQNVFHPLKAWVDPIHLQVEVTTHCNLKCVMCSHPKLITSPKHMSLSSFQQIFNRLKPLKVSLSGLGEPFLNPDMAEIIKYASNSGAQTITTSNMTVINKEKAKDVVASGLSLLKGSIDSTSPDTYFSIRKRDMHHKVLEGLANIKEAKKELGANRPLVRLQFVMQKSNYHEIPDVLDLCEDYGVDAIYFQPLDLANVANVTQEMTEQLIGDMDPAEFRGVLEYAAQKSKGYRVATNLPTLIRNFDSVWEKYRMVTSRSVVSSTCLMPWTSVYVSVDGDVRLCCSFASALGENLGNILESDFELTWNSEVYQQYRKLFRSGKRPHRICQNCIAPTLWGVVKSSGFFKYMLR